MQHSKQVPTQRFELLSEPYSELFLWCLQISSLQTSVRLRASTFGLHNCIKYSRTPALGSVGSRKLPCSNEAMKKRFKYFSALFPGACIERIRQ